MPKPLLSLLLAFFCHALWAQDVTFTGKVTDTAGVALEAATVYLARPKDSALIEYTATDRNGKWELKARTQKEPLFFRIDYVGHKPYRKTLPEIVTDIDFGTIRLKESITSLDTLVIVQEAPPIRMKKDTLEYNAASFKVRKNANVEALLKKLPGVVFEADGSITVNGKEVNEILVNGKPFFDADGAIALEHLPAELIEKVQVSDQKTEREKLAGLPAAGDKASINLTIDPKKNKGTFGTLMGGYGTRGRYEASAFGNYFDGDTKISASLASNNINTPSYLMNNPSFMGKRVRIRGIGGLPGAGNGLATAHAAAVNYSDKWTEALDGTVNYNYSESQSENRSRRETINYLPVGEDPDNPGTTIPLDFFTNSVTEGDNTSASHTANAIITYKPDKQLTVKYLPKFRHSSGEGTSFSERYSQRLQDGRLLNTSTSAAYNASSSASFDSRLTLHRNFERAGRSLGIDLSHSNGSGNTKNQNISSTLSYRYPGGTMETEADERNQVLYNNNSTANYAVQADYYEPINDSLRIITGLQYTIDRTDSERNSYDYDAATGGYTAFNGLLSNGRASETATLTPTLGVNITRFKLNINAQAGAAVTSFSNRALYMGTDYRFSRNYILPSGSLHASYMMPGGKNLDVNYSYAANFPQGQQVIPVADLSNPLNTVTGNPDLDPTQYHTVRISYRNFGRGMRGGLNIYSNTVFYDNQVVPFTITDQSARNITTYRNTSGTLSHSMNISWIKTFKKEAHSFSGTLSLSGNFMTNKGFLNGQEYNSASIGLTPSTGITYSYGELFDMSTYYNLSYNKYRYDNYSVNAASGLVHRINVETTAHWPKNLEFGNDFTYTHNSNTAPGFRNGFYMLNTSLGYSIMDEKLTFRAKVYDLLNQNTGINRVIDATTATDEESMVLRRYVMFSATLKLDHFSGIKK